MERIYELIEEISKEFTERFPEMTSADIRISADGYRRINVDRWDMGSRLPFDVMPRRSLLDQHKTPDGAWSADRSNDQNAYYEKLNTLMKE